MKFGNLLTENVSHKDTSYGFVNRNYLEKNKSTGTGSSLMFSQGVEKRVELGVTANRSTASSRGGGNVPELEHSTLSMPKPKEVCISWW